MVTVVGKDTITLKRNLKDIFPKEFSNRRLINQFITYILNNFFEKSQEKLISSYIGEVIPSIDGIDCYLSEPTAERQLNQIIPIVSINGDNKTNLSYSNFIAGLHNDGCEILNENKLLSSKYWSWCPPINVDMFINYNNYYWVKQDPDEMNFKVIPGVVNVEDDILGKSSYEYFEVDENGNKINNTSVVFEDGMRVVFLKDSSKMYNNIPYFVKMEGDKDKSISLVPVVTPIIVIGFETNVVADVLDKKAYTFKNDEYDMNFELVNGMRLVLLNDSNKEYNNKPFIVIGVGDKITLLEDLYRGNDYEKADYIIMERGCLDGNQWSNGNRWIHRTALEKFNTSSMDASTIGDISLDHAHMPIICFNKNIELYDCGTFDRGYVVAVSDLTPNDINGLMRLEVASKLNISYSDVVSGNTILLLGNKGSAPKQLYNITIFGQEDKVVLQPKENGQPINGKKSDGSSVIGDSVNVVGGKYAGQYLYYDGYTWKEGQRKNGVNDPIKFNLYDSDKILLNNSVQYPNSTFNGCILFDYMEDTSGNSVCDEFIGKPLVKDDLDMNYHFINHIEQDKYYYTPANAYTQEIVGYKFFRDIETNEFLNDWHLSENIAEQYIKTQVVANDLSMFDNETYKFELKYSISQDSIKQPILVYKNGSFVPTATMMTNEKNEQVPNPNIEGYYLDNKTLYLYKTAENDNFVISIITDDEIQTLDENYVYDYPLSLTTNQLNSEFSTIAYNNCFDQMIDIIQNQKGLVGESNGSNNYSSLKANLSVGTKIVQNASSIIRSMVLNDDSNSSVRNSLLYVSNAYAKFKKKVMNIINEMYIKGIISDDNMNLYETKPYEMDSIIKDILSRINIGKEGLQPFYNNGVMHLLDNAYVPSTPAYLGIANCYEPRFIEFTDYVKNDKPVVLLGHDGSYTRISGTIKDLLLKRFEELIYDSIQTKFKDAKCGINKLKFYPGKFRKGCYSREDYIKTFAPIFEQWVITNGLDHSENINFDFSTENPTAWKTWNYTNTLDKDGETLYGSYRAIYTYYYDTYRPHTHPWEMLGFGEQPSWWEGEYGPYPYTSNNINMWKDIENGYIANGQYKGTYEELKRPGLVEKYIPVDEQGELLSPHGIGIIEDTPLIQRAKARWNIGDMGDIEFAYMQTSEYRYAVELINYLLRPIEWVETNWSTTTKEVLFSNTTYEQTIDVETKKREDLSLVKMHNEYIDGSYVSNLGIQQWISDYLLSNNIDITTIADKIRNATVKLGYRCAGYYQKGTVSVVTDSYGELPEENVHINLFKSYNIGTPTYSGMIIEKTKKGYVIDGFDKSNPYFKVKVPENNSSYTTVEENGKTAFYYKQWKDGYETIPYRKECFTEQEIYNIINGYGKYLEEEEGWYFTTLTPSGELSNFRLSAKTFLKWSTTQQGDENIGNIVLLNPGSLGLGNYNKGMVEDMGLKIDGQIGVLDIYGNPLSRDEVSLIRRSYNTYIDSKTKNLALVKFRTFNFEHLITLDNKTIFDDVIYNPIYSNVLSRMKISGVKVKNWYGDLYAPGYLIENDGAIPNFDKKANDLQYMFDVDDVHCQGDYATYSKDIVGYTDTKTYRELFRNDKSMFDFYKGTIAEKGTKSFLNKLNRSKNISSAGNNIELFEQWLFKAGEFGHTSDKSTVELLLDTDKLIQNPQIITFENSVNYYYNKNNTYNIGDVVIYNSHEYKCLNNGVSGEFDITQWEKIRFVGNYIIFSDDKKWLKQQTTPYNTFKYSNDLSVNPIGGFPMTSDCEYIVFDEEEFDKIKDQMIVGETVWIAKLSNGDWDVKKKTGQNKFVSMRYATLKDLYNKNDCEYIYHFKDNNTDYYTYKNEDDTNDKIQLDTPIYSDIDCNNQVMKWADVTYPIHTGKMEKYINGTSHKIKLYNSVFTTLVDEENINSGTTIKELNNDDSYLTYSNLLLNMVQSDVETSIFKYLFTLSIDTKSPEYSITINGTEYKQQQTVKMIVCAGDVINWRTYAYGCGTRSGTINVPTNGEEVAPLTLKVPMTYRNGSVIGEFQTPQMGNITMNYPGVYEVQLVGAGGGAGGGSTKKGHKHGGNGGASGAYLHGYLTITPEDVDAVYSISIGSGGKGGSASRVAGGTASHGGDTIIYKTRYNKDSTISEAKAILVAQGGAGAWGARSDVRTSQDRKLGYGGTYSNDASIDDKFKISLDSKYGNNGGLGRYEGKPGASVYPKGTYGAGGKGVYKASGQSGVDGYMKIVYFSEGQGDYDDSDIEYIDAKLISKETLTSDSIDYSKYYQPYVIPPKEDKPTYFYSYDVIYEDKNRPNANKVDDLSKFYLNRSKSITAYHNSDVIVGELWVPGIEKKYYVGDTLTVSSTNNGKNCKYYICVKDDVISDKFESVRQENIHTTTYWAKTTTKNNNEWIANKPYNVDDTIKYREAGASKDTYYICIKDHDGRETFADTITEYDSVVYWEEYAPTYYYKITDNNTVDGGDDDLVPTSPQYGIDIKNEKYGYELYLDENCIVRATSNKSPYVLHCADLDFTRNPIIGSKYKLVDQFATYSQIKPMYLNEPLWSTINQVGTYPINSGMVDYYVATDKSTIDSINEKIYVDAQCLIPAKYVTIEVVDVDENGNAINVPYQQYKEIELTYSDISNVTYNYESISYELADNDLILYTSKPVGELELTDEVYSDSALENSVGVYGDYVPTWSKIIDFIPNRYVNNYHQIDYDSFKYSEDIFYKDEGSDSYSLYFNPSSCAEDGSLEFNTTSTNNKMIKLYKVNMSVVDNKKDLDKIESGLVKVTSDETKNDTTTYYQKQGDAWVYISNILDILTEDDFEQITSPLSIDVINNHSVYYTDGQYTGDTISNDTQYKGDDIISDITLYYNEQAIGKEIQSFSIVEETDELKEINIMFNNIEDDPIYQIMESIDGYIELNHGPKEALELALAEWQDKYEYVSKQEVEKWWSICGHDYKAKYNQHCVSHIAKLYHLYRNNEVDGKEKSTFVKAYLYGKTLYIVSDIYNCIENIYVEVANEIGSINEVATYTRNSSVPKDVFTIVNVITHKEKGDYFYISKDSLNSVLTYTNKDVELIRDSNNLSTMDGTLTKENKSGWMKVEYIDRDYLFEILALERKRIETKYIKNCKLVNNETDSTIINVQIFDPIQNIIPNNVLDEVNYISSLDPVNNYNDTGKWNEQKVGYLWWDTSKVRYVDYYQGDYEYKRLNWGKQLPGSEIAIMEWTKSIYQPTDGRKYITRQVYNHETNTMENHYYYWEKNPVDVPNVSFRKNSALVISSIINNPTDEGIIWVAPIDGNVYGKQENTLLFCNYNSVINGQEVVLQINMESDNNIGSHSEWVMVKENANSEVPSFLWDKMKDSLLGIKVLEDGTQLVVPNPSLVGRQKLGISMRPRQTMFDKLVSARENFIDAINDIFANRDVETINKDTSSSLVDVIDKPSVEYMDVASTKLEMMSWMDIGLVGQNILVQNDETLGGIWAVYQVEKINSGESGYKLVEYQEYDISKYLTYIDWYMDRNIQYITPTYVTSSSADAVEIVSQLQVDSIVKYQQENGEWELWQLKNNDGVLEPTLVAQSSKLLQVKDAIYNYVYDSLDNEKPFITTYKNDGELLVVDKVLTKYQYIYNETQYILEQLIDYFNV